MYKNHDCERRWSCLLAANLTQNFPVSKVSFPLSLINYLINFCASFLYIKLSSSSKKKKLHENSNINFSTHKETFTFIGRREEKREKNVKKEGGSSSLNGFVFLVYKIPNYEPKNINLRH